MSKDSMVMKGKGNDKNYDNLVGKFAKRTNQITGHNEADKKEKVRSYIIDRVDTDKITRSMFVESFDVQGLDRDFLSENTFSLLVRVVYFEVLLYTQTN